MSPGTDYCKTNTNLILNAILVKYIAYWMKLCSNKIIFEVPSESKNSINFTCSSRYRFCWFLSFFFGIITFFQFLTDHSPIPMVLQNITLHTLHSLLLGEDNKEMMHSVLKHLHSLEIFSVWVTLTYHIFYKYFLLIQCPKIIKHLLSLIICNGVTGQCASLFWLASTSLFQLPFSFGICFLIILFTSFSILIVLFFHFSTRTYLPCNHFFPYFQS